MYIVILIRQVAPVLLASIVKYIITHMSAYVAPHSKFLKANEGRCRRQASQEL